MVQLHIHCSEVSQQAPRKTHANLPRHSCLHASCSKRERSVVASSHGHAKPGDHVVAAASRGPKAPKAKQSAPRDEVHPAPHDPAPLQFSVYRGQTLFEPHTLSWTEDTLVPSSKPTARRHARASSSPSPPPMLAPSHAAAQAGVEPAAVEARRRSRSATSNNAELLFRVPQPHALSRMHRAHGGYGRHTGPSASGLARLLAAGAGPLLDREEERQLVQQVHAANALLEQLGGNVGGMHKVDGIATLSALVAGSDVSHLLDARDAAVLRKGSPPRVAGTTNQHTMVAMVDQPSSTPRCQDAHHPHDAAVDADAILAAGIEARRVLLLRNVRLVLSVAHMYHRRLHGAEGANVSLDDLVAVGVEGLSKGIDRFDLTKGVKLATYCYYYILIHMTDLVCELGRPFYVPRTVIEELSVIHGVASAFRAQHGRAPSAEEVKGLTQYSERAMGRLLQVQGLSTMSLDATWDEDGSSLKERLRDPSATPWAHRALQQVTMHAVDVLLNELPHKEARVVRLVYGLESGRPMQYREVAKVVGLSRARVGQLVQSALKRLRTRSQHFSTLDLTGEWHAIMEATTT